MITHKIDQGMVEKIYKSQFANTYEGYTISVSDINIVIEFNAIADAERFSLLENGVGLIVHDKTVLIDLARFLFVDAWDYFEGKGWFITVTYEFIQISKEKFINEETFWIGDSPNFGDYPSRLHAMAAAVKYMWEQEEKTNEH